MFGGDVTFESFRASLEALFAKAPSLTSIEARSIMLEEYHKQFGIADHSAFQDRPLSLVAMHPAEDCFTGSLLEERYTEFADLDIGSVFKISINEFLNMTHEECELMVRICRPRKVADNAAQEAVLKQIAEADRVAKLAMQQQQGQ